MQEGGVSRSMDTGGEFRGEGQIVLQAPGVDRLSFHSRGAGILILAGSRLGSKAVRMPIAGRNGPTWEAKLMSVRAASLARRAAPIPPNPNSKAKNNPETSPILPGM